MGLIINEHILKKKNYYLCCLHNNKIKCMHRPNIIKRFKRTSDFHKQFLLRINIFCGLQEVGPLQQFYLIKNDLPYNLYNFFRILPKYLLMHLSAFKQLKSLN